MYLIGDVGGTKIDLALISAEAGPRAPHRSVTYASADYDRLEDALAAFLSDPPGRLDGATLAVAGRVEAGRAELTNLPWVVEERGLCERLGVGRVVLMNDLLAIAHAVPYLTEADLLTLQPGRGAGPGAIGIVAPGTGLGEAFLTPRGDGYQPHPSEGGHGDFAPGTPLELDLLRDLSERLDHVSYEAVCSGKALPRLYEFLARRGHVPRSPALAQRIAAAEDPTPIIVAAAAEDPLCREAVQLFADILAAEAGNLALRVLATGGVYLAGGLPRRILPFLDCERWRARFRAKGRFSRFLEDLPVHAVLNAGAALLGAGYASLAATA